MCWTDIDRKLVHEQDLLDWICEKHIQVFGYNPTKTVHVRSGFLSTSRFCPTKPYVLSITYAIGAGKQEGIVYLDKQEVLHEWQIYISQNDYELYLDQTQQKEKENNMKNLQKANYIVKVQFAQCANDFNEKWTSRAILGTISNLHNDKFYNKQYNYAVPEGMFIKKGDYVLVTSSTADRLAIVKVVEIVKDSLKNMEEINKASSMIIGKVNMSSIIDQITQAERAKYLKAKIDELKKTFEERKMLEIMAQNDPEAAKLIKEYTNLTKYLPKTEE